MSGGVLAACSFVLPGLGQIAGGHIVRGILWFMVVFCGYAAFVVPGLVLHLACVIFASRIR